MLLSRSEMEELDERCYYAKWGYDGLGSIGPMESYAMYTAKRSAELRQLSFPNVKRANPFGARRNHKRGHGWKANHEG